MKIHNSHKKEQQDIVDSAERNREEEAKQSEERLIEKSKKQIENDDEEPDILEVLDASRDPDQTMDIDL